MIRINKNPELLKVGDKVTTDFTWRDTKVIRTITAIVSRPRYESGIAVSADNGNGLARENLNEIDAGWFIPIDQPASPPPPEQARRRE